MTIRSLISAALACFRGDKPVPVEYHPEHQDTVARYHAKIRKIMALHQERKALIARRATLRARKKKFTHLDPRLVEITTELLRLEGGSAESGAPHD